MFDPGLFLQRFLGTRTLSLIYRRVLGPPGGEAIYDSDLSFQGYTRALGDDLGQGRLGGGGKVGGEYACLVFNNYTETKRPGCVLAWNMGMG